MKTLASLALGLVLAVLTTARVAAVENSALWLTDLSKGMAKAKTDNKILLVNFTGSDWCPWCIKLHNEIFSKPAFIDYAKKNLVLVELDFPNNKPHAAEIKKANQPLADKYRVEGFPTVVTLNSQGQEIGRLGYVPGGPEKFLGELKSLTQKAKK